MPQGNFSVTLKTIRDHPTLAALPVTDDMPSLIRRTIDLVVDLIYWQLVPREGTKRAEFVAWTHTEMTRRAARPHWKQPNDIMIEESV